MEEEPLVLAEKLQTPAKPQPTRAWFFIVLMGVGVMMIVALGIVIPVVLVNHRSKNHQFVPTECTLAVIGSGWGGIYTAWRLGVHSGKIPPNEICIFEARERWGGRTLSVRPEGFTSVVDLGAYRFSPFQETIYGLIKTNQQLDSRCYENNCTDSWKLEVVTDQAGLNRGFITPMKEMVNQLVAAGMADLWLENQLSLIEHLETSEDEGNRFLLTMASGLHVRADNVILNIPPTSVSKLDPKSIIFADADPFLDEALALTACKDSASKFYVKYADAWWITILGKTSGTFQTFGSQPRLLGRFHDGPFVCENDAACFGWLLAFFGWDKNSNETYEFYRRFQGDPLHADTVHSDGSELLQLVHNQLMEFFKDDFAAHNISTESIEPPLIGLQSTWDCANNEWFPGTGGFNKSVLKSPMLPTYMQAVLQPSPGQQIFLVNEAYGQQGAWAETSLVLAERVLSSFFEVPRPEWVSEAYYNFTVTFKGDWIDLMPSSQPFYL